MEERRGPLTWGQQLGWVAQGVATMVHPRNLVTIVDIPVTEGVTGEAILRAIDGLITDYEAFRTTFVVVDTQPVQIVHAGDEARHEVITFEADADDSSVHDWLYRPFDTTNGWPVRAAIRCVADGSRKILLAAHCMVLDHAGASVIHDRVLAALNGRLAEHQSDPSWHPLDIAAHEHSSMGMRQNERSLEHWKRGLLREAASQSRVHGEEPLQAARLEVEMVAQKPRGYVNQIEAWSGTAASDIVAAAALLALAWNSGNDQLCATVAANNRSRRETRDSISPLIQRGLVSLAIDDSARFSEWQSEVKRAMFTAYRFAYLDPRQLQRLLVDLAHRRGGTVQPPPTINIVRQRDDAEPAATYGNDGSGVVLRSQSTPFNAVSVSVHLYRDWLAIRLVAGQHLLGPQAAKQLVGWIADILANGAREGDHHLQQLRSAIGGTAIVIPPADRKLAGVSPSRCRVGNPEREDAVVDAVVSTHPELSRAEIDLRQPYVLAGGRFEQMPSVLTALAERGYAGVTVDDLMDCVPLEALAAKATPLDLSSAGRGST